MLYSVPHIHFHSKHAIIATGWQIVDGQIGRMTNTGAGREINCKNSTQFWKRWFLFDP